MRNWMNLIRESEENGFLQQPFMVEWNAWAKAHGGEFQRDAAGQFNWIAPTWRATLSGFGSGYGSLTDGNDSAITINHIEVPEEHQRQGLGKQMMLTLCALADKHRVKLKLQADESNDVVGDEDDEDEEMGDYDEREHWLQTWYSSLGFDYDGYWGDYGPFMEREPQ